MRRTDRIAGFTLVEILIAMAVFLIGVVAIIGVFPEGLKTTSKSVDDTVAGYVVQSIRDALVDSIRRNVKDVENDNADDGYWVRWFHDGLPATGATYRLPRTFPVEAGDQAQPNAWGDTGSPITYNMPDYMKGAPGSANLGTVTWPSLPDNPNMAGSGEGMLSDLSAGGGKVTLNRGWWWPDMQLASDAFGTGAGEAGSLMDETNQNGGADPSTTSKLNTGISVVRLGTLSGTTASAKNERNVEFPDPLSTYSFQFIAQIFNDLTPGGDTVDDDPTSYIPCTPFPGEFQLIPEPFYPDNPAEGTMSNPKYPDRVRKDMRPGLMAVTFFPFKSWRPGFTGVAGGSMQQIDRDEAREQNCVRLFQFLVSFTQ